MATIERGTAAGRSRGRRSRVGWVLGGLTIAALVAVAVATLVSVRAPEPRSPSVGTVGGGRQGSLYTEQELAVMRLVAKGYIPAETLEGEPFLTKRLVNQGLVPWETVAQRQASISPLYSAKEQALMDAVAAGLVPAEALDGESFRTKRLINQGLIPREAAGP